MTKPSSTAGKACAECGMPDPCVHQIIADFPKNKEKHTWPTENPVHFILLDEEEGCEGTITIISKCKRSGCPESTLDEREENKSIPLKSDGSPNTVKLSYKGLNSDMDIIDGLHSPWEYLGNITAPRDFFDEPAHFSIVTNGCYECGSHMTIDVSPAVEARFNTQLSYEFGSSIRKRSDKERRDEQIDSRILMGNTLPKNKNKLRTGWQDHTDEFELTKNNAFSFNFGLKIANVDFSEEYAKKTKKSKKS